MPKQRAIGTIAYQCDFCEKLFPTEISALEHERKKHGVHSLCDWCGKPVKSRKALMDHVRKCKARRAMQGE